MQFIKPVITFFVAILISTAALAKSITVKMYRTTARAPGNYLGTITFTDTNFGMRITPKLHGIPAGIHGFHVHDKPNCNHNGLAAGGHFDPQATGHHRGPYDNSGHLGDLPALTANAKGRVTLPVLAPRNRVAELYGHAIIIHQSGDSYSDEPTLGGGGARFACGIVDKDNSSVSLIHSKH